MQNDKFTTDELPTRYMGHPAQLRRKVGTIIESSFTVQDDIYRTAKDDVFGSNFRPVEIEVHIDLDTAEYHVALSGPWYADGHPVASGTHGRAVFPGKDFLDADHHYNPLIVDAVIECLAAHGKVA